MHRKSSRPRFALRTFTFQKNPLAGKCRSSAADDDSFYRELFEHTPAIKLIIDPITQQIIDANPAACTFFGYERSHFRTLHLSDINTEPAPVVSNLVQNVANASEPMFQTRNRLASGEYRDVEVQSGALMRAGRRVHYAIIRDITERKRLEDKLRASEERLRLINDNIQDIVILDNPEVRPVFVSPSFSTTLGYDVSVLSKESPLQAVHPDDQTRVLATFQAARAACHPHLKLDFRLRHAAGHYLHIEMACKFLYDAHGQFTSGIYVARDITERKHLEDKLRANEERLRLINDNIQDVVIFDNAEASSVLVSPSFRTTLGFDASELSWQSLMVALHPDDQERVATTFQTARTVCSPNLNLDFRVRHADGHYLHIEMTCKFLYDAHSQFTSGIYVARDITERKRLEDQVRANEEHFRLIMDNTHDMVSLSDANGRMIYVSPACHVMLGREPDFFLGRNPVEYVHPDDQAPLLQNILAAALNHVHHVNVEVRLQHASGHYIPIELRETLLYDAQSNVIGGVAIMRDITQQKSMQEILLESERTRAALEKEQELSILKTRMMERVAHEFRTPLTAIHMATESLTYYYDRLSPEKRLQKKEIVSSQMERITEMLNEIERTFRSAKTSTRLLRTPTDMSALCHKIAAELAVSLNLPEKFQLELPDTLFAPVDIGVLEESITHIMRNAARYSAPAAPVIVRLTPSAASLELRIIDRGIGIPPDELPYIFEPFFRATNVDERSGLGVGLTIARTIVEAHGGTIRLESQLNRGTTVIITLPA